MTKRAILSVLLLGSVLVATGCGDDEPKPFEQPGRMNPDGTPQEPQKFGPARPIPPPPRF